MTAFNLEDDQHMNAFLRGAPRELAVPGSGRTISYDNMKRIGVGISRLGTSRAIAVGAYVFALATLDQRS